ncbi:hypothetical protein [Devosia epidermidihirudinis]|uniref:hypothetical protein n=1 Tax=Devosia epidermidihirudinis TaxID=1293439 RepID=UPI0012E37CB4|nr:hypothetical protein [Devosia epidermidihirudinis]
MSRDIADLLKVLAVTLLLFGVATLVMLYVIYLLTQYGGNLPLISALPVKTPPALVPMLADNRLFATLAAAHVTATGLALLISSNTIDMALLITSKAVTVVLTALLGFVGGHMIYLQLTEKIAFNIAPLTPAFITFVVFLVLSSFLSAYNVRQWGKLRFVAAVVGILAGPLLLVWL